MGVEVSIASFPEDWHQWHIDVLQLFPCVELGTKTGRSMDKLAALEVR
jgi:hypothetical protein